MESISWYYDKENNYFIDEDGVVIFDIHKIISVNLLLKIKELPGYTYIKKRWYYL